MSGSMGLFVLVTLLQWLGGFGAISSLRTSLPRSLHIPMALMIGMFLQSVFIYILGMIGGVHQYTIILASLAVVVAGHCNYKTAMQGWRNLFSKPSFTIHIAEIVALLFAVKLYYVVAWSGWYWPVTPFDAMAGIDLVARQTVLDGNFVNQIYTHPSLQGNLSNQPFYAPFAMLMQVQMWGLGFTSSQLWLPLFSIAFVWSMLVWLHRTIHPALAAAIWLFMVITPEWFGYQYLLQTDFSNAAFFASACLLLVSAYKNNTTRELLLSALFFGAACWSRNETILLTGLVLVASAYWFRKSISYLVIIAGMGLLFFALWNVVHVMWVLPVRPDAAAELGAISSGRLGEVLRQFFGNTYINIGLWGYQPFAWIAALVVSVVVVRKNNKPMPWLLIACVAALFVGFILIGTLFTSAIVSQTLRRAIFKLIPLQVMILAMSPIMQELSSRITAWELRKRA